MKPGTVFRSLAKRTRRVLFRFFSSAYIFPRLFFFAIGLAGLIISYHYLTILLNLTQKITPDTVKNYDLKFINDLFLTFLSVGSVGVFLGLLGIPTKFKFGDYEFEIEKKLAEKSNATTAEIKDLNSKLDQLKTPAVRKAEIIQMPPLPPINNRDDPQKGRFGGLPEVAPYRLYAQFTGGKNAKLAVVTLIVERTDNTPMTSRAKFFLHDTFAVNEFFVGPVDGKISVTQTVWGGFTVGVWIENSQVFLELDLAQIPNAPDIIKYN